MSLCVFVCGICVCMCVCVCGMCVCESDCVCVCVHVCVSTGAVREKKVLKRLLQLELYFSPSTNSSCAGYLRLVCFVSLKDSSEYTVPVKSLDTFSKLLTGTVNGFGRLSLVIVVSWYTMAFMSIKFWAMED